MSFTRIPLKLTRLFEIHLDETNPTAHGDNGVPRYLTTQMLEQAAAEGIGRPGSYSLNIIPDVAIEDDARNCVLAYRTSDHKFASDKPFTVLDIRVAGASTLNANMQSEIPLSDNSTIGLCMLSNEAGATANNAAATPINVKNQMGNSVFAKFHVVTNVPSAGVTIEGPTNADLNSGASLNIKEGSYQCNFRDVTGYDTPHRTSFSYTAGAEKVVTATYSKLTGKLRVFTDNENGKWSLDQSAPISSWHASGDEVEVNCSDSGTNFTVFFSTVGNVTPSVQFVKVFKGKTAYATGSYAS